MLTIEHRFMKPTHYEEMAYIADQHDLDSVFQRIIKGFIANEMRVQKIHESYFDTFEWGLFAAGLLLKHTSNGFYLSDNTDNQFISEKSNFLKKFFWWDLDDGHLKDALKTAADIRALVEVVRVTVSRRQIDLLNKDRKTVVRLFIDHGVAKSGGKEKELPPILRVSQIRGYEKAYKALSAKLLRLKLTQLDNDQSYLQFALEAVDRQTLDYSSKFSVDLAPGVTIQDTVSEIGLFLVRAMERNIPGVLEDVDSEFLHDFRIAVRRTRSLIGQMKKLIPPEETVFFQNEFKWLGTITGPVRDLDVYLLMRDEYKSMLPDQLHQGLDDFFNDLEKGRGNSMKDMHNGLNSSRYQKFMNAWLRFLTGKDGTVWPKGGEQCQVYAVKLIRKTLTKILKDGGTITPQTPDAQLHALRIQGKKLRYLLEFFRSFFQADDVDYFLKQLKKLQNNLGDFNDVSVQSDMLTGCLQDLQGRGKRSIQTAAAVGGLITHLHNRHSRIRQKFEGTFTAFSTEDNEIKFKGMLS